MALAACATVGQKAGVCAGMRQQPITTAMIVAARTSESDKRALQAAVANNEYGYQQGCWRKPKGAS